MNDLVDAVVPITIFGAVVWIIKIVCDYKTRNRLIDKGLVDEKVKFLYRGGEQNRSLANLKWGIVLIGIGVAALVSYWFPRSFSEEGTIGLMFLFAGFGFLTHYFVAASREKKE
jgi:hypothetical protein